MRETEMRDYLIYTLRGLRICATVLGTQGGNALKLVVPNELLSGESSDLITIGSLLKGMEDATDGKINKIPTIVPRRQDQARDHVGAKLL